MKSKLLCLSVLFLLAHTAFTQEEAPPPGDDAESGRPVFEWTSGNFFDIRLFTFGFTPLDPWDEGVGLDYWSGYHHLSFPLPKDREIYIGFARGFINFFGELGVGFNFRTNDTAVSWEVHLTGFGGPLVSRYSQTISFGLRNAIKYQVTEGRVHFFVGIGATLTYHSPDIIALSFPLETGLTISSRRTEPESEA